MEKFTKELYEVTLAKTYMYEYKYLVECHKIKIGIIGRLFEKIFGTDFYGDLEIKLYDEYHMNWFDAYNILIKTNNKNYIYE